MINRWYGDCLFQARAAIFLTTLVLVAIMLFADPFCYACDGVDVVCPGCGVKTGLTQALSGDFIASAESNPLSLLLAFALLMGFLDFVVGLVLRRRIVFRDGSERSIE